MNILFANYGDSENNSSHHIRGFAKEMAARGHGCVIAATKLSAKATSMREDGYTVSTHKAIIEKGATFPDGRPADILHVWTPREIIRMFAGNYSRRWGSSGVIVHLEDDEEVIFERCTGRSPATLRQCAESEWKPPIVPGLVHPIRYLAFLSEAAAVTVVHRGLGEILPTSMALHELPPIIDPDIFHGGPKDADLARSLDIPDDAQVIGYNGNDHFANTDDIRMLNGTIDELLKRRPNLIFVRTGHVIDTNHAGFSFAGGPQHRELGFVDRRRLPDLMRLSDVFIQPGNDDKFNAHRLPAKIPEYLCLGRPLIVSRANIGRELAESGAARVLEPMTIPALVTEVEHLLDDPKGARELGQQGRRFALKRFDRQSIGDVLETIYLDAAKRPKAAPPSE